MVSSGGCNWSGEEVGSVVAMWVGVWCGSGWRVVGGGVGEWVDSSIIGMYVCMRS